MASWRDAASPEAQGDLDGLLDLAVRFAKRMLTEEGEFFPFGAAVDDTGQQRLLGADPGLGEQPPSADVLAYLLHGARNESDHLRAVALACDVLVDGSDAVRVHIEHREGIVLTALLPYQRRRRNKIEYGTLSASLGEPQIWT